MSAVPAPPGPAALARGFATGGVTGATLSAFVAGIILERVPLILIAWGLPLGYGLLLFLAGLPRRAREESVVPRLALARIEGRHAGGTETGDVPLTLMLTIAPGDAPSFRTEITEHVNLVDLPRYRTGDVLVVAYPPDRPWRARVVPEPAAEWRRRAAGAVVEPAPESTLVHEPPEGWAFAVAVLIGLVLGAAVVLGRFHGELFAPEPAVEEPSSSTSTTSSAGSATVTVTGSLLDAGALRRAVDALAGTTDVSQVLTAVVQDHRLSVVFAPTDAPVPRFDLREVPVDRIPDLVRQATSTHDVGAPRTWQVTIVRLPAESTVRATVTGPGGSASVVLPPR
ncbi:hypothetical protein [Amycolatopsis sp. CA-128772]|uniref:hypothetical protein n=1 Tax=Amycolatopsis sp. CA-128772 TaxID=2073159 RepID=UPI000CD10BA8|nr:hypothetical protein [Amycolatopsis sp. CA-128772]